MAGVDPAAMHGSGNIGRVHEWAFIRMARLQVLSFGQERVTITGCGKLVPDVLAYTDHEKAKSTFDQCEKPAQLVCSLDGK